MRKKKSIASHPDPAKETILTESVSENCFQGCQFDRRLKTPVSKGLTAEQRAVLFAEQTFRESDELRELNDTLEQLFEENWD
jgi:hypothetical protein